MEVAVVLFDGIFQNPSGKVRHHLGVDKLAFVHNSGLVIATNLANRSLQIVKYQRAI
jgi:hypothetical protein